MKPYRPGFGYTLALKGAYDEQLADHQPPHCEEGCYCCEIEAHGVFERWVRESSEVGCVIHAIEVSAC